MQMNHTTANVFPATDGLEVYDMIEVMADRTGEAYTAMNLNYWGKGEYLTLVPCDAASDAPRFKVERNMWGAYILDNDFRYNAKAQALFAGHIAMMEEVEAIAADVSDYEGFAVDLRVAHDAPVAPAAAQPAVLDEDLDLDHDLDFSIEGMEADDDAAIVLATPAPLALITPVAQPSPETIPTIIITPLVIRAADGRILTATATGWQAESATKPNTFHTVAQDGSTCSCLGSLYHGKCWHRTAVYAHTGNTPPVSRPRRSRMWK